MKRFISNQQQLQQNTPAGSSTSSSFDSYMLQRSNAFKWLSISSKCALEDYAQACIKLIIGNQLPVPTEGITTLVQPHHADVLIRGLQQAQIQALKDVLAAQQQLRVKEQECQSAVNEAAVLRATVGRLQEAEGDALRKSRDVERLTKSGAKLCERLKDAAEPVGRISCRECRKPLYKVPGQEVLADYCLYCGKAQPTHNSLALPPSVTLPRSRYSAS